MTDPRDRRTDMRHRRAGRAIVQLLRNGLDFVQVLSLVGVGLISALLALVNVQRGMRGELARIRDVLEHRSRIVSIGLSATTTPKEGTHT